MESMTKELTTRKTMQEYAAERDRIIGLFKHAIRAMDGAKHEIAQIVLHPSLPSIPYHISVEKMIKEVDQSFWRHTFRITGLTALLDAKATRDMEREIEDSPPPFTIENIETHYLSLYHRRQELFDRSIYETFRQIDQYAYRTNARETFKIPPKIVQGYVFERWMGRISLRYARTPWINDLDRIFCTLDGQTFTPHSLESDIQEVLKTGATQFENDYLKIKAFNNGNAHIWFKRHDLLDLANERIHHYTEGQALGADAA